MSQNARRIKKSVERWREQVGVEKPVTRSPTSLSPLNPTLFLDATNRRRRSNSQVLLQGRAEILSVASVHSNSNEEPPFKKRKREDEELFPISEADPTTFAEFTLPPPSILPESVSLSLESSSSNMSSHPTSSPKIDNIDAGAIHPELASIRKRLEESLDRRILGHMPVVDFLDHFLPKADGEPETDHKRRMANIKSLVKLQKSEKEADIYVDLATAFTKLSDSKINFRVSANKTDSTTGHRFRPDVMGYHSHESISEEDETNWKAVDLFVEAKMSHLSDGFVNVNVPFESLSEASKDTRSQFIHYMDSQWKYQHREHGFCVQFIGKTSQVRLLRFDPAGIIVSGSLKLGDRSKFAEDNRLLAEFLYRFGQASKRRRGWSSAWESVDEHEQDFEPITESLGCQPESKTIVNEETYYTGPRKSPRFFRSRATVGYRATRWVDKGGAFLPCFIKGTYQIKTTPCDTATAHHGNNVGSGDTGAFANEYRANEGEVYLKLQENEVSHVPTLIFQHECAPTVTDDHISEDWVKEKPPPMTKQVHRLLIFEEYAKPIQEFSTVEEMLRAWMDAISAYKQAVEKAGQMHRDISAANILINDDGSGLLSDWDQSVGLSEPRAHLDGRTGTVIFMAVSLLMNRSEVRHHPKHDLESYYHLLVFLIYFYVPNPLTSSEIENLTLLYRLLPCIPSPFFNLAQNKRSEINDGSGIVTKEKLLDGTWGPLGPLLARLREEVILPLQPQKGLTLTWQEVADKMIALAKEVLDLKHNDLAKGRCKHEDVTLPWEKEWNFRSSVAVSKRPRSPTSDDVPPERPKRLRSSQSSSASEGLGDWGRSASEAELASVTEDEEWEDEDSGNDNPKDEDYRERPRRK